MKKKWLTIWMTIVMAVATCLGFVACDDEQLPPVKLGAVTVTLDENVAVWGEVNNASRYAYTIDDGAVVETTLRQVPLRDGDSIRVKAVGDGLRYTDGDYCEKVTYHAPALVPLDDVHIVFSGAKVSWAVVAHASAYVYQIDNGAEVTTTARSVFLEDGQSIKVKAKGDGIRYSDGGYCAPKIYRAPTIPEYTTILVKQTINEGDTLTLGSIALPQGFAWKDATAEVTESGEVIVNYTDANGTVDAKVYIDLTVVPAPTPELPEGVTIVVKKTIDEGDTLTLADIALPQGFAWKDATTTVSASGAFAATYTSNGITEDWQVYVDLTINSKPVEPEPVPELPDNITIVVKKTIDEGDTLTLADIALPQGFAWKDATTTVSASGAFAANYTSNGITEEWQVYVDLTIIPAPVIPEPEPEPEPTPTVPAYTTVVVKYTINEGQTLCLDMIGLPQGFTWQVPGGVVTESGYYAATYTDANGSAEAFIYLDLTIIPAEVDETPAYTTIVVAKHVVENQSFTLSEIPLPAGFTWQVPGGVVTESGFYAAYYKGTIFASIYIDVIVEKEEIVAQKLGDVSLTIKGHTASWVAVENAVRYAYRINDGEVVETTLRSVTINAGDSIEVKALGDGVRYLDGNYCAKVVHATIYDGPINEGDTVVTINALDTAASATASGAIATTALTTLKTQGNASYYVNYAQQVSVTIPMMRNGAAMTVDKLRLYKSLRLSVMISGDDLFSAAAKANAPTVRVGSQVFTPDSWKAGWNDLYLDIETLIADGFTTSVTATVTRPTSGNYIIYFDDLAGVYPEKLDLGNVMVFGDSYSTYDGYLRDNRFFYYADRAVSQTDVDSVTQTWWGQVIANTNSNLIMNDSVAGSTVAGYTYGCTNEEGWPPQDTFFERLDTLIADGYFNRNKVDTILMYGGTNDAWGQTANIAGTVFQGQYTMGTAKYSNWTKEDLNYVLPAYCYFISKALEHTDATIVIMLNASEVMGRNIFSTQTRDVQAEIIRAVKGFAEYGTRIQLVAFSDHEYNDIDISIGSHPTKAGMTAIKNQLLNVLYERKYLTADKCTEYGDPIVVGGTALESFSGEPTIYHVSNANLTLDRSVSADGAWKATPITTGALAYVVGPAGAGFSLNGYSQMTVRVYANAQASGMTIYLDSGRTVALGTLREGWNEFTVATSSVKIDHGDGSHPHVRFAFIFTNASAAIYFDTITVL